MSLAEEISKQASVSNAGNGQTMSVNPAFIRTIVGVIMGLRRFSQTFTLTLLFYLLTCVAASGERAGLRRHGPTNHYPTITKELSKTKDEPLKIEKFIKQSVESITASQADGAASRAEEKPEAARPGDVSSVPGKVNLNIAVRPLLSRSSQPRSLLERAYLDAYSILQESNSCSRFFGGPRIATGVLNSLQPRLQTAVIENHVGINMLGPVTFVTDYETGVNYRLFQKALVNLRGPFYKSANYQSQNFFHKIGYYPANTREARVTMLLHELGHLLPDSQGHWLLLDDGNNPLQVAANTSTIMQKCREQINSLSTVKD
jgi:hypothetical protein